MRMFMGLSLRRKTTGATPLSEGHFHGRYLAWGLMGLRFQVKGSGFGA